MADDVRGLPQHVEQRSNEIGFDRQVERAIAWPVRRVAIAAKVRGDRPEIRAKRLDHIGPLASRAGGAMQQHDRFANAGGEVLETDAAGIDGRTTDALLLEGHHAAFNDLDAASRPCLMSATMSSLCSMPTERRT